MVDCGPDQKDEPDVNGSDCAENAGSDLRPSDRSDVWSCFSDRFKEEAGIPKKQ